MTTLKATWGSRRLRTVGRHRGRTVRGLVLAAFVLLVGLVAASPANAQTPPGGYVSTGTWTGSGSTFSSPLPAPYSGTVTYSAGAGQTTVVDAGSLRSYPTSASDYQFCLNGHTAAPDDYVLNCRTYTATLTFSQPVTDPVVALAIGGGGWSNGTDCAEYWENVTVSGVNGSAPTSGQVAPTSTLDSPLTWADNTLSYPPSSVGCSAVSTNLQYVKVSGTVTTVSLTYTVAAKAVKYTAGQIGASAIGGTSVDVLVPTIESDLSVVKTADVVGTVGGGISYTMVVKNNGPDPAFSWTLTDPLPAGFSGATTSTPGCTITGSTLTCTGTNLAVGGTVTVQVNGTASTTGVITNTATVTTTSTDTVPGNNTSTATVTVIAVPLANVWVLAGAVPLIALVVTFSRRRRRMTTAHSA